MKSITSVMRNVNQASLMLNREKNFILFLTLLMVLTSSCDSYTGVKVSNIDATAQLKPATPTDTSLQAASKAKFAPFNNVNDVRQKLSAVGIGELGRWHEDEMGSYMSITTYYKFGGSNVTNNLAYYLESDNHNSIKSLKLVLIINDGNRKTALSKFAETIGKTYEVLGLERDTKIMNQAKFGKELSTESSTYTARTELEKSRIETWKFIIETK